MAQARSGRRTFPILCAVLLAMSMLTARGAGPAYGNHDGPPVIGEEGPSVPQVHRPTGGSAVRIYGEGLLGTTAVTIGGAAALDFRVVDSDLIIATVPPANIPLVQNDGFAHITVTDDEGTGTTDLDRDGVVDTSACAQQRPGDACFAFGPELGAIFYTDATFTLSPATGLDGGESLTATLTGHQPNQQWPIVQLNPLVNFLEDGPADPDTFPVGPAYGGPIIFPTTDANGNTGPKTVSVDASPTFNAKDQDFDADADCPVAQATADHGLGRCIIGYSEFGMASMEAYFAYSPDLPNLDPVPAAPTLVLTPSTGASGAPVLVSGANWSAAPHFGSDTSPDDPGESSLTIEVCTSNQSSCVPAASPDAEVSLTRYRDADPTNPCSSGVSPPCIQPSYSGATLSGSFAANTGGCAPGCVVRVRQQRYDIESNAPVPGDFITATAPFTVANRAPSAVGDTYTTPEDTVLTVAAPGVLANDTDPEATPLAAAVAGGPAHGSLALNGNGSFSYTPAADFNGTDSFTYTASDGAASGTATVTIVVAAVNDPPVAADDSYSTAEGVDLVVPLPGVLVNDTDVDGGPLSAAVVTGTANGTLVLAAAGSFSYRPRPGFNGVDLFSYSVADGRGGVATATARITVTAVNHAPVAVDDAYTTLEDTVLRVPARGVLANDTDAEGDPLTAAVVTGPAKGTLALAADGSFTYSPNANVNGVDSFTYRASDGALSGVGSVTITVEAVNDPPVATDDAFAVAAGTVLTVAAPGVLSNDTDVEGAPLRAAVVSGPSGGTLVLNVDGSFSYTPRAGFSGRDSFTYSAGDGTGGSGVATVVLTVTSVNRAPVANDDRYTTVEDTVLSVPAPGVLRNDTDAEGSTLSAVVASGPGKGTLNLHPDGSFTYTPNANANGTDTFTYSASDGAATSPATVTITVSAVNDRPIAVGDSYSTPEDTPLVLGPPGVLANDTDVEASPLTAAVAGGPAHGSLALNGNGSFSYTPAADFNGTDSFTYTASDGAASGTATVTITVAAVNDAPVAVDDSYSTAEGVDLAVPLPGVLANDVDVDGDPLTVAVVVGTASGTLAVPPSGSFSYRPKPGFNGVDLFSYSAADGRGGVTRATVRITVTAVNDAPMAVDDAYTTPEDTVLTAAAPGVLGNDTDAEGSSLTAAVVTGPTKGVLTLSGNGSFRYVPNANVNGVDSFTYRASDGLLSDVATVTITVAAVNDPPVAVDDSFATAAGTVLAVAAPGVLGNDSDIEGAVLTAGVATGPSNGRLALQANGSFSYTPNSGFVGLDSFTYVVADGAGGSDVGMVVVSVSSVNTAPNAVDDAYATAEDTTLTVPAPGVLANDIDAEGASLLVAVASGPTRGKVTFRADGSFTYTPNADLTGPDSFTYTATDGSLTDTATVTIAVSPVNDAPVALDDVYTTAEDTVLTVGPPGVLGNDFDVDSSALTALLSLAGGPGHGTVVMNGNGSFGYTPAANFNGTDTFAYTVSDGAAWDTGTVTVTVTPVNDAPVAGDDAYTALEDTTLTVAAPGVLANDTDVDRGPLVVGVVSAPVHGNLAIRDDGSLTYRPDPDFNGSDLFVYRVADGIAAAQGTVTITVLAINDAPSAGDDSMPVNGSLTVAAPGLLSNDDDPDGDALRAALASGPAHGTATVNVDGSFTYTPTAGFRGRDAFTYVATDGSGATSTATVHLTVAVTARPADLGVRISESRDPVRSGRTLLLRLTVRNHGPARATGVALDATVYGAHVRYVVASRGSRCSVRRTVVQHIHCDVANLGLGRKATIIIVVRAAGTTPPIVTTASVRGAPPDPFGRNNEDVEFTRVRRR